jgi:hypothetical protein
VRNERLYQREAGRSVRKLHHWRLRKCSGGVSNGRDVNAGYAMSAAAVLKYAFAAAALLVVAGGCSNDPTSAPVTAKTNPIFEPDIVPIFGKSCGSDNAGCHRREAFNINQASGCRGWLSLENIPLGSVVYAGPTAGTATGCPDLGLYERLFANAWMCGPPTDSNEPHVAYVVPCEPKASLLYRVLGDGPLCSRMENYMPIGGKADPADVQTIFNWIANGAPRLNHPGASCGSDGSTAPVSPGEVTVEPMGDGLHVSWKDHSDNEDHFVVERHEGSGTFLDVIALPFDSTSYHDAPLTSGRTYTYRVGAKNALGKAYSEAASGQAP